MSDQHTRPQGYFMGKISFDSATPSNCTREPQWAPQPITQSPLPSITRGFPQAWTPIQPAAQPLTVPDPRRDPKLSPTPLRNVRSMLFHERYTPQPKIPPSSPKPRTAIKSIFQQLKNPATPTSVYLQLVERLASELRTWNG
jgi:hypothetical protein